MKPPNKNNAGAAQIIVVLMSLTILALAALLVAVTVNSRNISAGYRNFSGLYDMAVAGNEQAFRVFEEAFARYGNDAYAYAVGLYLNGDAVDYKQIFYRDMKFYIEQELANNFTAIGFDNRFTRNWTLSIDVTPQGIHELYIAETVVRISGAVYEIETYVTKATNETENRPQNGVAVRSIFRWDENEIPEILFRDEQNEFHYLSFDINFLDFYTPRMLELTRVPARTILRTGNFFRLNSTFPVRRNRKSHGQVKFLSVHGI